MTKIVDIRDRQIRTLKAQVSSLGKLVISLETRVEELEDDLLKEQLHFERDAFEMRAMRLRLITINEAMG